MMATEAAAGPIPDQPGFPIDWESPEDPQRFWEREAMHVPGQTSTLAFWFMRRLIDNGFNVACDAYSMPIRNRYALVNSYVYQSIAPVSHDPDELAAVGAEAQRRLGEAMGRSAALWRDEQLPEIQAAVGWWDGFDLAGADTPEFVRHLDETVERFDRMWELHFMIVFPIVISIASFDDLHHELFDEGTFDSYRLLAGFDTLSLAADRAMWSLSRTASASPEVRGLLETGDVSEALERLPGFEEGRAFLDALDGYLEQYGKRSQGVVSIDRPSWIEEPSRVLEIVRDMMAQPDRDPGRQLAAQADERDRLVAEARSRLEGRPEDVRGTFEFLLGVAQQSGVIAEDHNFWIDNRVCYEVRRVVLELGRRLVASGALDEPDDVFHLTLEEAREALVTGGEDRRELVAARRRELDRFAGVREPTVIGTLPPGPPPDDPLSRAIKKFFGAPPARSDDARVVLGLPGSPGTVRGTARIVMALPDAARLEPGDVLVTPTTSPPWTALFGVAGAIVTDTGGILSHCAVVAREYEIPAVVGTKVATSTIRDGQLIEVDGSEGIVRIVEG
jgi:pyruvate,water dikinase